VRGEDVAALLEGVPPVELKGPGLLARLQELERAGQLTEGVYAQLQPEIEVALGELSTHLDGVREVVKRCMELRAVPSGRVPVGW